ncbi:MAG: class I SAM-dependent methyltransferase [Candidatus Micrarchaeota archaeon]
MRRRRVDEAGAAVRRLEAIGELLQTEPTKISVEFLFKAVNSFVQVKRKQDEVLVRMQSAIKEVYDNFSPAQRVSFFAMLYDQFSENYDRHMGVETRHYQAIRDVMDFAAPFLRPPIIDLTAGTGEPLRYALEIMKRSDRMRKAGIETRLVSPPSERRVLIANEISLKMLAKAKEKLGGDARYINESAYDFPGHYGRGNTVLVSQTFHLIKDEDKPRLVRGVFNSLSPGGIAVVMEEDRFMITPLLPDAIRLFIGAIAEPLKHHGDLVGAFIANGFAKLENRAVSPIDSEHSMRLHLFQRQ